MPCTTARVESKSRKSPAAAPHDPPKMAKNQKLHVYSFNVGPRRVSFRYSPAESPSFALGRSRCRRRMVASIAPLDGRASRTSGPQRRICTPSTSSASRAPPSWCSVARREYRQPYAGAVLTLCALRAHPTSLASCRSTIPTVPRLVGTRFAACRAVHHASVESIVDGRGMPLASQVQGSMSSLRAAGR